MDVASEEWQIGTDQAARDHKLRQIVQRISGRAQA
jgi:hypothetical protein